jgi:hypothetical protein
MYTENTKGLARLLKEYFYIVFVRSTTGYCRDRRAIFDQIDSINRNKVEVRRGWIQFPLLFKKSTDLVTKALYRYIGNYKINKKNLLPEIKQSRNFRKYYPRLNILQLSLIYTCSTRQKGKSILNEIEIS